MAVTRGASKRQRIEPKHALEVLPGSAWRIIGKHVADFDRVAFGFTCKTFLEAVTMATANPDLKKKVALKTDLRGHRLFEEMPRFSLNWFQWVFQSFERRKGAPGLWHGPGWYYDHFYDSHLMYLAAFQGSKKAMEWLVSQGIPLKIKGKYFRSVNNEVVAVLGAAAGGHIAMLEWLRSKGCEFDESTCSGAAKGGHLDVLKWLRSQDPPCDWDQETCRKAARRGHLDVLQWARSQDPPCDWNWRTCSDAARGGHLDVLKWLRSQDPPCPWDAWTCLGAAGGGHLDVLQWARSQDPPCDWGEMTCGWAAGGGHLDVLKWARSQDPPCDWGELTCSDAARGGHLDVLQWARSQDPPCPWDPIECMVWADSRKDQHVIEWINANS